MRSRSGEVEDVLREYKMMLLVTRTHLFFTQLYKAAVLTTAYRQNFDHHCQKRRAE